MTCPKTSHGFCALHECPVSFPQLTCLYKCAKDINDSYSFYNKRSIIFFWRDHISFMVYTCGFSATHVALVQSHTIVTKTSQIHYYKWNSLSMISLKVYHNTRSLISVHAQPIIKQPLPVWILLLKNMLWDNGHVLDTTNLFCYVHMVEFGY